MELPQVLDFILNKADSSELAAVGEAIKRRMSSGSQGGDMARDMAKTISQQISYSQDAIRDMVRGFVTDLIRKEAPEIPEEDLQELLKAWVPNPDEMVPVKSNVPPDVLKTMIRQFIEYSTDTMRPTEQIELHNNLPNWKEQYWASFPRRVQLWIKAFLAGEIEIEQFWEGIDQEI
jgi:hypothetical protein